MTKEYINHGDEVNFRALITSKETDAPIEKDANVCIYDGNDNKVYNEKAKTSEYGILSGNFKLANEVNSGIYKLVIKTETNETTKTFKVNPYVTPKYEVEIAFDKENYLVGENAKINIDAKYFFGEPVSNAKYTVFVNEKESSTLVADEQGNAIFNYKILNTGTYSIKVEAVDSSNYYVETAENFVAGNDIFEIELVPEYGILAAGKRNDVYVFTTNSDGTPLKTYVTVSSDKYTKQIATDENGIGKFSIDVDSLPDFEDYYVRNSNKTAPIKTFNINAENMSGDKVQKNITLDVRNKNLLLDTDKIKYEQGEDIKINISSVLDVPKNIYLFKNDKLLKMVTTDSDETSVNLDDEYGLIDIYVTQKGNSNDYYYYYFDYDYSDRSTYKRTIFVKPEKELNIAINTNKNEYVPSENITISFETKDENNKYVDSALLVSMLDDAILSLANNDLSIDNIKMALSDINFSNDLDAATLYSCIIDEKSEQTMMALLLKQSSSDMRINEITIYTYQNEEEAALISILSIILLIIMVLIYLSVKFDGFRRFIKHTINAFVYTIGIVSFVVCIIDEFFWRMFDFSEWSVLFIIIVALATYIAWVSKLLDKMYKTSLTFMLIPMILSTLAILVDVMNVSIGIILLVIALFILVFAILSKINEIRKLKIDKFIRKTTSLIAYILKFICAFIISAFVGNIIEEITDIYEIVVPISIGFIYVLNYLFNKPKIKDDISTDDDVKSNNDIFMAIISILACVGIFAIGYYIIDLFSYGYGDIAASTMNPVTSGGPTIGSSTALDSAIRFPSFGLGNLSSEVAVEDDSIITNGKIEKNEETVTTSIDDNVRKVFLESMCFIPELIAQNGQAQLDLKLSDNITTWTIQTVGNTKDGRIGYGTLNDIKVFKEFFVDFELPKNLIKTDKVSIPVTVYNYTENTVNVKLKVKEDTWFDLEKNDINVNVLPKSTKLVYIPITILESGNYKFRVEATDGKLTDIVEKTLDISPKGYKVEKVVSTGILDEDISEDILILEKVVENTASAKVKIYGSAMAQNIEGLENIFRMPTGCFEQVSSSLYPNIVALKYMEDNQLIDTELREKALGYITSGYQKLLTYEVPGEPGGYSLYGDWPAEVALTAYGLMEFTDLKDVYPVDESVIEEMNNFLYKKQKLNGSFDTGHYQYYYNSRDDLSLNAYIIWALSESDPKNEKLSKSVEYLKNNLEDVNDNYTLAIIANVLANVEDKEVDNVIKRLMNNVKLNGNTAYLTSNIRDYYGSYGSSQNIQTVALASMALTKTSSNYDVNKMFINYLVGSKDAWGTWYSTQATVMALKALNLSNEKQKLNEQTIIVTINSEEQQIKIADNPLEIYEVTFDNLKKENKLDIDIEKGSAYYEVVETYYIPYEEVDTAEDEIEVSVTTNSNLNVNELLKAKIKLINNSKEDIYNGMVTITIPQGFVIVEESLMFLKDKGIIEKYEMNYTTLNLYLRNFDAAQIITMDVEFRASYPVNVTGLAIRAYDYYNPEIEGKLLPSKIIVNG